MSDYTNELHAEQLIRYIANDYVELSHDKVRDQRDEYIKICRDWLDANGKRYAKRIAIEDKEAIADKILEIEVLGGYSRTWSGEGEDFEPNRYIEELSTYYEKEDVLKFLSEEG